MSHPFTIFLVCVPGLEDMLAAEAAELGFDTPRVVRGGVEFSGGWPDVWRANIWLRGATRVLVRIGRFKATNLGQLEKSAAAFRWSDILAPREPVDVEVTCRKSRISNAAAATQRFERALRTAYIPVTKAAVVSVKVRIDKDIATLSLDTSGDLLHKRGFKEAVSKAPMRESMAAMFLRRCGFVPGEQVLDPMCGSGTFPIEAAEIAAGLAPGRKRSFAFEKLLSFDANAVGKLRKSADAIGPTKAYGFDRDAGAIRSAVANAKRASVRCSFEQRGVGELVAPPGPPGLVITNPPYGARIGDIGALMALYRTLGQRLLRPEFRGWRVGIITTDAKLAHATGLPFEPMGAPVAHGGLKVWMFHTAPLVA